MPDARQPNINASQRPVRSMDGMVRHRPVERPQQPVAVVHEQTPMEAVPTPPHQPALSRRPRRGPRWWLTRAGVTVAVIATLGTLALFATWLRPSTNKFAAINIAKSVAKVAIAAAPPALAGQDKNRTNIVVYGMTKDGLRTDSIMLASYYYAEHKLVTINIPRDLYVYDGFENAKMGEVYSYAKSREPKSPDYPSQYVAGLLSKEYGIPIQYWFKLNMQGEVQLVDTIGGVDVTVANAFTDYEYPTWDYSGYVRPAPHFNAGLQHMDGARALIFSRSRHSLDKGEGSDFARSKRQAIVLAAVMEKVTSLGILGNLADVSKYLDILGKNVDTNMSTDEMVAAAQLFKGVNPQTDYLKGNWATGNGFLCASTSSVGAYIALYGVPGDCSTEAGGKDNSTYRQQAIHYIQNLLESVAAGPSASSSPSPSPVVSPSAAPSTGASNQ